MTCIKIAEEPKLDERTHLLLPRAASTTVLENNIFV
jgi:hypothetical protein